MPPLRRHPEPGFLGLLAIGVALLIAVPLAEGSKTSSPAVVGGPIPSTPSRGPGIPSAPVNMEPSSARPAAAGDANPAALLPVGYSLADVVVANTNATLAGTDTFTDWEPSLSVNPSNPNQLASYTFSSSWPSNAAVWYSSNGGVTWTKEFTWPQPTGVAAAAGCPCDVTVDYDRSSRLFESALNLPAIGGDIYTGETTDPTTVSGWSWFVPATTAQKTDGQVNAGGDNADQPQLRINRDPVTSPQDDAYVAYDDFTTGLVRVAVAAGSAPPDFARDSSPGPFGCCVNPGARLAPDPSNGTMYALWQYATGTNPDGSKAILYGLNRSTDAGNTWTLNGSPTGIVVASANSDQPTPKFGGVNALLGGVDAVAVDPTNGDAYVVYGTKDGTTGKNRLAITRLSANGSGGLTIGTPSFVTGQVQAALPSVAVASNGVIGVLYDTFDGTNGSGFPIFSAHMAESGDHGATFSDVTLVTFTSPFTDNGNSRQRILGDYQQLRVDGTTFFGMFSANGAAFGRSLSNIDPIFLKAPALAVRRTGPPPPAPSGRPGVPVLPIPVGVRPPPPGQ